MRVLAAVTLAAIAIGILGARADADAQGTKVVGTVDDTATISLKHADGTPVTTLTPGAYDFEVTDSTAAHNFHLSGPGGLDESTTVPGQESPTWPLTLGDGDYHYVCDEHAYMAGHFTVVGSSPPPPPGPPPPGPPPPGPPPPSGPPPPAPPPPPPPTQHPPPLAAALSRLSVRVAPGRVVVATVQAAAPTRATMELRRGARRLQSKRASLKTGRNVLRMQVRRSVRPGRYLLVVRTTAGRALTHRLRLR